MARKKKTLAQIVLDGTFLARQDEELLLGPDLPWPAFVVLQRKFQLARDDFVRRATSREFEKLVKKAHAEVSQTGVPAASVAPQVAALGPPRSYKQLEGFFPWAFSHYKGPLTGQPFHLERFQRKFLREFWRRRPDGSRVYKVGLFGVPKGSGKTPLAAGLGLHTMITETDAPEVFGIAGSKGQAGIAQEFANAWIEDGPLSTVLRQGRTITSTEHRGFYKVLSSDGRLAQGVNPSAAIVDEWWLFTHQRERESYNALGKALHKRQGQSWLLAITTAGFDKQSQLGETYDKAVKHPKLEYHDDGFLLVLRDEESGFFMHWYGLPEGREDEFDIEDPSVVRRCNPAPWVDPRELVADLHRPDTDESDWRRLHLNAWTKSRNAWLPLGLWNGLASDAEIRDGAELFVGVDVGWSHDSTAVAWATRLEDGRIAVRAKVWTTEADQLGEYVAGGQMRLDLVEDFIRGLRSGHRVRQVAYDPNYFGRSAQLLEADGFVTVEMLPSSAPMIEAWQSFYQAAKEGRITHDRDPVLASHVEAAAADRTERGLRVRKLKSTSRIDALAATVLAHSRCDLETRGGPPAAPTVYWLD